MNWLFLDFGRWDYDVATPLARPLGGSQSAMCYLATALARAGDHVAVVTGVETPREISGVHCCNFEEIPARIVEPRDSVVVVLNGPGDIADQVRAGTPVRRPVILWTQHGYDQPAMESLHDRAASAAWDHIVCISDWHKATFQEHFGMPVNKIDVLRNAISPLFENMFSSSDQLGVAKALELRLAYTSTPFRGLDVLIACFPLLRRRHPSCRLDVFSSLQVYRAAPEEEDEHRALYDLCRATPGVSYRGSISQRELAKELAGVTMLAYPNTFAETSCIAVMEALAAGLAVVSTELGALPETCDGWARLIPPVSAERTPEQFAVDFVHHADQVLTELQTDKARWMQRLFEQSQAINATCTWDIRAQEWQQAARRWLQSFS